MPSQVFTTTGTTTWTWPVGVTTVIAECLGGGGAGGLAAGSPATGGGGKGGQYVRKTITKGAETQLGITVAAQVQASSVQQPSGGTVVCRALGGNSGSSGVTNSSNGLASSTYISGTAIGDVIFDGGNGAQGNFTSGVQGSGAGGGAAGPTGNGGNANVNAAGIAGTGLFQNGVAYQTAGGAGVGDNTVGVTPGRGGGGSGGKAITSADRAGGAGGTGVVVLTWATPPQAMATIL